MKNFYSQGENIYTNFQQSHCRFNKKVRGILIASPGVGKSLLFNNLCKGDQKVAVSKSIVTDNICLKACKYQANNLLFILDAPGIDKKN